MLGKRRASDYFMSVFSEVSLSSQARCAVMFMMWMICFYSCDSGAYLHLTSHFNKKKDFEVKSMCSAVCSDLDFLSLLEKS